MLSVAVLLLLSKILWSHPPTVVEDAASDKSIAVLPFVNMSGEATNDYFSDGITEEILNAATQIPGLRVAARTSAFQFKGKNVDLRQVGQVLGVAYVLEGSVQRAGDSVRITAQLIDARSGYHRWSEKFDRKLTNIFGVEDEIAGAIVSQLQIQMDQQRQGPLVKVGTDNPQAHELYLKALALITARGRGLNGAVEDLKQAVAMDPRYAAAWAALAPTCELLPWYSQGEWDASLDCAQSAAQKALALDDSVAAAHAGLATVLRDRADYAGADKAYQKALELDPQSAEILDQYAQYLFLVGRYEEGAAGERKAMMLDPLAPNPHLQLGLLLLMQNHYDEAEQQFAIVEKALPEHGLNNFTIALVDLHKGDVAGAEAHARAAAVTGHIDPDVAAALIRAAADPAQRAAAIQQVAGFVGSAPAMSVPPPAWWYCLLGDPARGVAAAEAWAAGAPRQRIIVDSFYYQSPVFDPIRTDPRFRAALEKSGLPAAAMEAEAQVETPK